MPTATLVNGTTDYGAGPPALVVQAVNSTGRRDYQIDTPDIEAAATASGLPTLGTSWGGSIAALTAQRIRIERVISHPNGGSPEGLCWARVEYETPGLVNSTSAGFPGLKYSRVNATTTSFVAMTDVRVTDANAGTYESGTDLDGVDWENFYADPIEEGRGVTKEKGLIEIEVTRFLEYEDVDSTLLAKLVLLADAQAVNEDSVTIPDIVGTTVGWTFAPGELRFNRFAIGGDNSVARISMLMYAARDHRYRWEKTNEFGRKMPGFVRRRVQIYREEEFQAAPVLW